MATLIGWLNSVFGSTGAPVAVLLLGIVTFVVIASGPTLWSDWRNGRLYKNRAVRQAAAESLGELGDTRAVEPLIVALEDSDSLVRHRAAEALGKLGDKRAVEPLIIALQGKNVEVRCAAARALGEIWDARAVDPLIAVLQDEDVEVRRAATRALGEIEDAQVAEPLIAALGPIRREATEKLKALKRHLWLLQRRAAQTGIQTDPAVLIEIEDIGRKIEDIERKISVQFSELPE